MPGEIKKLQRDVQTMFPQSGRNCRRVIHVHLYLISGISNTLLYLIIIKVLMSATSVWLEISLDESVVR